MVERKYEQEATVFAEALRIFAKNPDAIDNIESYLSYHFGSWFEKWANTPEGLAREMAMFAMIGVNE